MKYEIYVVFEHCFVFTYYFTKIIETASDKK